MKDFKKAAEDIAENFEKTFEKAADDAVKDPNDNRTTWEAQRAGEDAIHKAGDAAGAEAQDHGVLKVRHIAAAVEKPAEHGWLKFLKFLGGVTAIFAASLTYLHFTPDERADQARRDIAAIRRQAAEREREMDTLEKITVDQASLNSMARALFVESPPTPTDARDPQAAAAALPPPIAALAAEPATAELTRDGEKATVTTTVGQVYLSAPREVRRVMERPNIPPPPITHGYDGPGITTDPNSCFVRHCMSGTQHKSFTVDSGFAKVSVSY